MTLINLQDTLNIYKWLLKQIKNNGHLQLKENTIKFEKKIKLQVSLFLSKCLLSVFFMWAFHLNVLSRWELLVFISIFSKMLPNKLVHFLVNITNQRDISLQEVKELNQVKIKLEKLNSRYWRCNKLKD